MTTMVIRVTSTSCRVVLALNVPPVGLNRSLGRMWRPVIPSDSVKRNLAGFVHAQTPPLMCHPPPLERGMAVILTKVLTASYIAAKSTNLATWMTNRGPNG